MTTLPETGYTPTPEDLAEIERWFAAYDALSAARDVEGMADMAVFPLNLVSDDAAGTGASAQWDREQFVATMTQVMGQGGEALSFTSERTPVFLSPAMAVVFTDSVMTAGGATQRLRYADVLIRREGGWAFQTMVQSGWGENLR
ncbi:nuclear transport factor 2 family protein [Streptomyces sp. t39]|uniref:nuclear transport factor 2 family protein n=1 Tax=Streptomyces sp. t39 TaxID=1828156 RepID=UPI0011CE0FA8|nr:nuclear transport factor 2 family protein [Streptomyces sp. t39]TXS56898.1 nuclear transport factor 2 family protein [Streptomyces sp. t39]